MFRNIFRKVFSFVLIVFLLANPGASQATLAQEDIPTPAVLQTEAPADFNNHACADLVVGSPGESKEDAPAIGGYGALYLMWSNLDLTGLHTGGYQYWYQGAPTSGTPITDTRETADYFGLVLASGNFNGDYYNDLVVGVPYEDVGTLNDAGVVQILYGSATGFLSGVNQYFGQNTPLSVAGTAEANDLFGSALAVGDFDGDGYDDLAVGAPGEAVGSATNAGYVNVLYGGPGGVTTTSNRGLSQDSADGLTEIIDVAEKDDRFGAALTAGDFDHDGYADLAVGAPGESAGGYTSVGMINVIYGSSQGLNAAGNQAFGEDSYIGIMGSGDNFGGSLAAGDFDHDDYTDLAIGAHLTDELIGDDDVGVVYILYGSAYFGITTNRSDQFWQSDVLAVSEANDWFGAALAVGDFDGDSYADLAISAPGDDINDVPNSGMVGVLYGGIAGLTPTGAQNLTQVTLGMTNEADDYFGGSLAAGDFNCDHRDDLIIGVSKEDLLTTAVDAGAIVEVHGSLNGLDGDHAEFWSQESTNITEVSEAGDWFGFAITSVVVPWQLIYLPVVRK